MAGDVKIFDLALCMEMQKRKHAEPVGNTYIMAPEMVKHQRYAKEVDIWSLGVCVLELLLSKSPLRRFTGKGGRLKVMFDVATQGYPRPLFEQECEWSAEIKDFLEKCLDADPDKRASAEQLLVHPWLGKGINKKEFKKFYGTTFLQPTLDNLFI